MDTRKSNADSVGHTEHCCGCRLILVPFEPGPFSGPLFRVVPFPVATIRSSASFANVSRIPISNEIIGAGVTCCH